ncbi:PorP/SprF family type IX secretion system membrane protein [Parasediminibacterium sp. JCM 36343]|uniref:PorP/SprF family type IX secretion system membrane protein n=1 Tax=Parasediminibacterium sp. JCM 36343 TaxID=3374279 RepID=UPI00397BF897
MSKIKQLLAVALVAVFTSHPAKAQVEPHFSQYYMYPLWLNPALTGAIDGNYRVAAIHRNQWSGIDNGFSTTGLSADFVTKKNINLGVNLLQQNAGSVGYKYNNAQVSVCYTGVRFGHEGDKVITFALQGGLLNRRFDLSKAQSDNQFNPNTGSYDPSRSLDEAGKSSATSFDMNAGMFYYDADPDKKVNIFAGFAAGHITQPEDPSLSAGYHEKLPVRYTVHGGANIYLSEKAHLIPNALYMRQGSVSETMLGGYVQFAATSTTDVMLGANYRINDAYYPYAGLSFDSFTLGLSYDVTTSQLGKTINGTGSFELSLMYTGKKKEKGFFKSPRF